MRRKNWIRKLALLGAGTALAVGLTSCSESGASENEVAAEENSGGWFSSLTSKSVEHTLQAGSILTVRTTSTLSTKTNETGERFTASLEQPLEVDGVVVAPKGSRVTGTIASSDPGGRVKGVAQIVLALSEVEIDGQTYPISSDSYVSAAKKTITKDTQKVGIGAGVGAAIGAIAGGGDGAAKGAGVGAGLGTAAVLGTRGDAAVVPAESVITFTLATPVTVQAD